MTELTAIQIPDLEEIQTLANEDYFPLRKTADGIDKRIGYKSLRDMIAAVDAYQGQLILNGAGQLGDLTNWTGFTGIDKADAPNAPLSFVCSLPAENINYSCLATKAIQIDTAGSYQLSFFMTSNVQVRPMLVMLDAMQQIVTASTVQRLADARLVQPLRPGDTIVYLDDVTSWGNSVAAKYRYLVIWNYKDADGKNYGEYTYSRHTIADSINGAWDNGAIDAIAKTVTLRAPFPATLANPDAPDGAWPIGHAVSNGAGGDSYQYPLGVLPPAPNWQSYTVTLAGVFLDGVINPLQFRPGTHYLQVGFLLLGSTAPRWLKVCNVRLERIS